MADEKTAQTETTKTEEDPFKDFQSEEFDRGEPVVADPPAKEEEKLTGELEEKEETPPAKESESKPPAKEEGEPAPPTKEGEQPPAVKTKKSPQERINEITRARREAERRAEAAERERDDLKRRLQEPPKKEEPAPAKKTAVEEVDPKAPKPEDFEFGELDPRYIRAIAGHEADRRFAELRKEDADARETRELEDRQEAAREQFETMIERGSKVHEDFYEKVVIGAENGQWPLSKELGELALASEVGNDVLYHLASNPREADQVFRSSPVEQARYFGRMEAKLSAERTAAPGKDTGKPAPKLPKAPAPIDTARGAGGQSNATADTEDFAAFEARASGSK